VTAATSVLHVARGRVRVRWSNGWGDGEPDVRRLLERIAGARSVRASPLTRNVLVEFDENVTNARQVVAELEVLARPPLGGPAGPDEAPTRTEPAGHPIRRPLGVEPTTLILVERMGQALGACVGVAVVAVRRGRGDAPAASRRAAGVVAAVSVISGSPGVRGLMRRALGRDGMTSAMGATAIVAQTLAGNPLGLAVAGVVAVRQVVELLERRRALRAYAGRATVNTPEGERWLARIDDGERLPLAGRVVRGSGAVIAPDGLPRRVRRGARLGAGARLFGGPFVVELHRSPAGRSAPVRPPAESTPYLAWLDVASLVAGALTFIATRSMSRAVGVMLLLSPRPSLLANEAADAGANIRALRCGALPTRDDVVLNRPDVVLVGSPRVLSDGLQLEGTVSLDPSLDPDEAAQLAVSVAALAGWPWGPIQGPDGRMAEGDGTFDGAAAHATVEGRRFSLLCERTAPAGAKERLSLVLCSDGDRLAVLPVRPRLGCDAKLFVDTCRRLRMDVALVHNARETAPTRELAEEAGLGLVRGGLTNAVRRAGRGGRQVAVVTDAGDEGEWRSLSSLSIGLVANSSEPNGAAADVLAPDLASAAAVLEASALRAVSLKDARRVALATTLLASARMARGAPSHQTATTLPNLAALAGLTLAWLRFRGG